MWEGYGVSRREGCLFDDEEVFLVGFGVWDVFEEIS